MIQFVTLLIGLLTGVQAVEVTVGEPVARVELRLDGRVVAERTTEPWILRFDLGQQPRPAVLEVVAFDAEGRQLGSDRQLLNLPGQRAEAAIVAERDAAGRVVAARVTWHGHELGDPKKIRVTIDGDKVDLSFPYRVNLARYGDDEVHVMSAEVVFSKDLVLRRELAFGMGFSGVLSTDLTAIPVISSDGSELPEIAAMAGWFEDQGSPVEVAAVDRGQADVVMVVHPGIETRRKELWTSRHHWRELDREAMVGVDQLGDDVRVRVMLPEPVVGDVMRGRPSLFFPLSEKRTSGNVGIFRLSKALDPDQVVSTNLRLANAVALAGMRSAEEDRRRAVLLLLGDARQDRSFLTPAATAAYLRDLAVPLEIWDMSSDESDPQPGWTVDRTIVDLDDLRRAVRRFRTQLERQRIVWLAGQHLPQNIALSSRAEGIEIAR